MPRGTENITKHDDSLLKEGGKPNTGLNCLSTNGLFGTNMFLVEFGLVQVNTRIIEILCHKSILFQGKSGTMFKMWWHFFIYIKFTFSKSIEHNWEYISRFTVHVELFLQFFVHDIKCKLGPPCNKSNLFHFESPLTWDYFYLMPLPPTPIWFFSTPPPDNYCTVPYW